jgi:hypothetical protein
MSVTRTTSTISYNNLYKGNSTRFWLGAAAMMIVGTVSMVQMQRFLVAERYSSINLKSNVSTGKIYLNRHPAGYLKNGNQVLKNLSPGIYDMEIHGIGPFGVYQTRIDLPPARDANIFADIPDRNTQVHLITSSSPARAKVFLDDQLVGETPLSGLKTRSGTHQIKLVKDGYKTLHARIELQNNQSYHLNYTLVPDSPDSN